MKRLALLLPLLIILSFSTGCVTQEELANLRQESANATAVANEARDDYDRLVTEYEALVASGEGDTEAAQKMLDTLNDKAELVHAAHAKVVETNAAIQSAETQGDLWANISTVALGMIPGGAVVLPFVELFRRRFNGTVAAVSAGGGPRNPAAASRAMPPKLRTVVGNVRRKQGDHTDHSANGPIT